MKKLGVSALVAGAVLCAVPYSLHVSAEQGVSLSVDTAAAVIGRPFTPYSVAGAYRRGYRRSFAYGSYGGGYGYRHSGYGYRAGYGGYGHYGYGYRSAGYARPYGYGAYRRPYGYGGYARPYGYGGGGYAPSSYYGAPAEGYGYGYGYTPAPVAAPMPVTYGYTYAMPVYTTVYPVYLQQQQYCPW
jgi:hypothetical protein